MNNRKSSIIKKLVIHIPLMQMYRNVKNVGNVRMGTFGFDLSLPLSIHNSFSRGFVVVTGTNATNIILRC